MTLDALLNDRALGLAAPNARSNEGERVRFLPFSAFAHDFHLPPGTEGIITARFEMEGDKCLNLLIEGVPGTGFASGVPEGEVERISAPAHPRRT